MAGIHQNIFGDHNYIVGQGTLNLIQQLPQLDREGYRNLAILRDKVKQFWIGGVLEECIHGRTPIALDRQSVAAAVDHPWASTLELPGQTTQLLPSNKKTSEIFYECERALLILGEPGSGKTITLLESTRDFIRKSEIDPTQPVPVIFNLSSWSARQPPLFAWLIEELRTKYFVSRKLAELWLQQNRLLLLLDGLDEVVAEARSACVEAINKHVEEHGSSGIVVCCRIGDYVALPLKLKFNAAICVQPLTSDQIDQYLQRGGDSLATLRQLVSDNVEFRELARMPLMLSIMSLAYENVTRQQITTNDLISLESRRKEVFDRFIDKMCARRPGGNRPFGKETTMKWLASLARQMTQRAESIFLIEKLQPSWLPYRAEQWTYFFLSRGVSSVLLVALLIGVDNTSHFAPGTSALFSIVTLTLGGVFTGMVEGLMFLHWNSANRSPWRAVSRRFAIYGGISALVVGVVMLDEYRHLNVGVLIYPGVVHLLAATTFGSLFGIIFGIRASRQSVQFDIQTVERLTWSWTRAMQVGLRGLLAGLVLSASFGLVFGTAHQVFGWMSALPGGGSRPPKSYLLELMTGSFWGIFVSSLVIGSIISLLVGFLFGGLVGGLAKTRARANQGIRLSGRNAFWAGWPIGLFFGFVLSSIVIVLFEGSPPHWILTVCEAVSWDSSLAMVSICGIFSGILLGLVVGLWYGGFDIIQHYTLRLLLWQRGYTPRKLMRFLDHASDLIFLQKVGGGYIFIHRLLLDHFAAMESPCSPLGRHRISHTH